MHAYPEIQKRTSGSHEGSEQVRHTGRCVCVWEGGGSGGGEGIAQRENTRSRNGHHMDALPFRSTGNTALKKSFVAIRNNGQPREWMTGFPWGK